MIFFAVSYNNYIKIQEKTDIRIPSFAEFAKLVAAAS